jgi:outer membrane murein-binding lipoprotein Lpp
MPVDQQGLARSSPLLVTAALATSCGLLLGLSGPTHAESADVAALEQRIAELNKELEQAKRELAAAKRQTSAAEEKAAKAEAELATRAEPESDKFRIGPVTIGGAMRVNYILGSYPNGGSGPSRGGNGGNFELDTYRINMALSYERLAGKLEYRWYNGYNFIHTGWLGYDLAEGSQLQVGVTRVPFGPGPYGVSQSWFFDQHYYVGLADDPDLGIKYVTEIGDWNLDLAYFVSSEWNGNGTSADSARYGYDAVSWRSAIDENGDVVGAPVNGYQERNQVNLRAIYSFSEAAIPTDLGVSLQYGQLEGRRADDGSHWAASAHMVNQIGNFKLATQLTRYEIDIDDDNLLGTDELIAMGAYDFAWPVATKAWIPAISLSYKLETPGIPWLDYVLPYLEYSSIVKDARAFNDSQMWTLGAAWARGGWYIYSDFVYSDGNYFIGDDGDDYSNIYRGVGDFGVTGNDKWNYRFNINLGYYF